MHLLAALLLGDARAGAQPVAPATLQAAQQINAQAVAAMDAGAYQTACPMFAQVVQMIPQGNGARESLADCYRLWGKLASAWRTYAAVHKAADEGGQTDRQQRAATQLGALRPQLAELTITVPVALRGLPGLEVRHGGEVVQPTQWGESIPVDSGPHVVEANVGGESRWKRHFDVADGDRVEFEVVITLPTTGSAPGTTAPRVAPEAPRARPVQPTQQDLPKRAPQRTVGVFLGVLGASWLGAGAFALAAKESGAKMSRRAEGAQTPLNIALVAVSAAGGAALTFGVVLVLTAPSPKTESGMQVAGPAGIRVGGTW